MFKRLIFVFAVVATFVLNGCGGGGGSSLPSEPSDSQKASLNSANSKKSALSSFKSTGILKDSDLSDIYGSNINSINKNLRAVSKEAKSLALRVVAYSEDYDCDSGYAKVDKISDSKAEVEYHNCYIDGVKYSGNATVEHINSSYVKVTFEDFQASDDSEKLYIDYAIFEIDQATSMVKIKKAYLTQSNGSKKIKFLNYNTSYIYDSSSDRGTLTFSGWVDSDCLGGYVYIKSTPEIAFNDYDNIEGSFEISSKGKKVTIEFDEDVVYITDTNGVQESILLEDIDDELDNLCP